MTKISLIPTPIGNLGDITLRALELLKTVDVIAAEDTRHSRKLLSHYGIDTHLVRLDAHTIQTRAQGLLDAHHHIGFITDAGTPGISDPGVELVNLALSRGDEVEVLPGATAFVPALVLSGFPTARFTFEGFLPRKGKDRHQRLEHIASSPATSILFEAPGRVPATLHDLMSVCGEARAISISRELSKLHETTYRGTLAQLHADLSQTVIKGEVVIVVAPATEIQGSDYHQQAEALVAQGLSGRELREALIAAGTPRNLAYRIALNYANTSSG